MDRNVWINWSSRYEIRRRAFIREKTEFVRDHMSKNDMINYSTNEANVLMYRGQPWEEHVRQAWEQLCEEEGLDKRKSSQV